MVLNASTNPDVDNYKEHCQGHIPGARFLDLQLVRDWTKPYPYMMPLPDQFLRVVKAMDVRKSQTIVVYENYKGWFATRAAFMLQAYGHTNVYVLDGGFAKWTKEGHAVEDDSVDNWDAEFDYNLDESHIVSYEQVNEIVKDGSVQMIENRPADMVAETGTFPHAI